jgi:putative tryptophan/tyrosine transport system substrate-binding protein
MAIHIRRRELIFTLGGAAAVWPLAAGAQQPAMPVIGFLKGTTPAEWAPFVTAVRRGLSESGFVEGRNVDIVYKWAEVDFRNRARPKGIRLS